MDVSDLERRYIFLTFMKVFMLLPSIKEVYASETEETYCIFPKKKRTVCFEIWKGYVSFRE